MLGRWSFDYALIPFRQRERLAAYHEAYSFNAPPRAVTTSLHKGFLPAKDSIINVFPSSFILSAIKEAEDGTGWILRGYNLLSEPILVTLDLWKGFSQIMRVNLAEQVLNKINAANGRLQFTAQGHEIVTLKFVD
jgi:alpha-mannosidase